MMFSSKMIGILNNMIMNQCIINHHHDIRVLGRSLWYRPSFSVVRGEWIPVWSTTYQPSEAWAVLGNDKVTTK